MFISRHCLNYKTILSKKERERREHDARFKKVSFKSFIAFLKTSLDFSEFVLKYVLQYLTRSS